MLGASSETRRYYGEDFRAVGEAQMAGWDLDCLNVGPCLDAVLPLNYAVALGLYKGFKNVRGTRSQIEFSYAS